MCDSADAKDPRASRLRDSPHELKWPPTTVDTRSEADLYISNRSGLLRMVAVCAFSILFSALPALSQGVQTGAISGIITSIDHLPLPGVTVTVTSPALQGAREAAADSNGVYHVNGLP